MTNRRYSVVDVSLSYASDRFGNDKHSLRRRRKPCLDVLKVLLD
jgi:hypothetical protein